MNGYKKKAYCQEDLCQKLDPCPLQCINANREARYWLLRGQKDDLNKASSIACGL